MFHHDDQRLGVTLGLEARPLCGWETRSKFDRNNIIDEADLPLPSRTDSMAK